MKESGSQSSPSSRDPSHLGQRRDAYAPPEATSGSPRTRATIGTSSRPVPRGSILSNAGSRTSRANRFARGTYRSVHQLIRAILRYLRQHNDNRRPFVWTASAATILRKVRHCKEPTPSDRRAKAATPRAPMTSATYTPLISPTTIGPTPKMEYRATSEQDVEDPGTTEPDVPGWLKFASDNFACIKKCCGVEIAGLIPMQTAVAGPPSTRGPR